MKRIKAYAVMAVLAVLLGCEEKDVETDCKGQATNQPCTKEYNPVCGCDGITYGNACEATASGVKYYTPGECGTN